MLTAESEGGQVKCHPYWGDGRYGPLALMRNSEKHVLLEKGDPNDSSAPHIIVRRFYLRHSHQPFHPVREIVQLQYASWADFGTPAHPAHIVALIKYTETIVGSTQGQGSANCSTLSPSLALPPASGQRPIIVHCSAGCGRTGVFCAVDTAINMMRRQQQYRQHRNPAATSREYSPDAASPAESGDNEWMDRDDEDLICQVVSEFRHQRMSMVQNLRQFVLCYDTVLEWVSQTSGERLSV